MSSIKTRDSSDPLFDCISSNLDLSLDIFIKMCKTVHLKKTLS